MCRSLLVAGCLVALSAAPSVAVADLRVWEDNAPVDPSASAEDEGEESTTTSTTTNPDGTTTSTTTTTRTHHAARTVQHRPFLDDYRWLDVTGFVQPGYIQRLTSSAEGNVAGITDSGWWLQRARFGIRAQLFDWLRMRVELETQTTPNLTDAFIDVAPTPWLQFRVGQMLVPFLQQYRYTELNLSLLDRPMYMPVFPDRTYIRYFNPRDIGLQIFGRVGDESPSSMTPVFQYQLALMNGSGPNVALNSDGVFLYAARLTLYALGLPVGVDRQNDLARNHLPRPTIAFGGYSNCDDRGNWNRGFTADFDFRWEGLFVEGSFVWTRNSASGSANPIMAGGAVQLHGQHDAVFLADSNQCAGVPDSTTTPTSDPMFVIPGTRDFVSRGAHLQAQYVLPRVLMDLPFSLMDLEVLFRADWVDANSPYAASDPLFGGGPGSPGYIAPPSYTDPDNPPTRWRLTFGLNFYPTGQSEIRLGINYQLNRQTENVNISGMTYVGVHDDIFWLQLTAGI